MWRFGLGIGLLAGSFVPAQAQRYSDCIIEPVIVVEIGAPVEGVVESIAVDRGEAVQVGDIIAQLDAGVETETVRLAKIQAASDIDIRIAEARADLAKKEADRARELADREVGTKSQLDIALAAYKTALLELARAKENVLLNQLEADRAQVILDRRTILSPIDGIVLRRLIGPGEFAHSQAQIAQLASIDPLHVDVFLPTELYNEVVIGQRVTVYPGEPIGGSYEAIIQSVDQVFDAASDTFGIRLELPNPEKRLPGGVDCAVSFDAGG